MTLAQGPLVWIDCEMTGLDLDKDSLLEVAVLVTDSDLKLYDKNGFQAVIHKDANELSKMNEWCIEHHGNSGLTGRCLESTKTTKEVETELMKYIHKHVTEPRTALLAGNSVHVDRMFLLKEMPSFIDFLHYRIVDVSTIKELAKRWRNDVATSLPEQQKKHRAMDDIRESIEEVGIHAGPGCLKPV